MLAALPLGAVFGARAIASSMLDGALRARGMACESVSLDVAWDLSSATLGPLRCTLSEGALEVLEVREGASITLRDRRPTAVSMRDLSLVQRHTEDAPHGELAAALLAGEVPERLARALDGLAALSQRDDVPTLDVANLYATRDGATIVAHDLHLERSVDGEVTLSLASAEPPPGGRGPVRVRGRMVSLGGRASAQSAELSGRLVIELDLGRFEADRSIGFRLSGTELDGDDPRYALWVEPSPMLERARAFLAQLRERRGDLAERIEERREDARERREEMRERVHDLRERLDRRVEERRARSAPPAE